MELGSHYLHAHLHDRTCSVLPGLPITIVGGILFGHSGGRLYHHQRNFRGLRRLPCGPLYCKRLGRRESSISPRWRRLDEGVRDHGWKVVAFTRLIPLFPFNLLNYAFGLTKIKFLHYAITTFICMLPACIAFIVFSSPCSDVIRGKISPAFIAGLGLIILVSLIPLFYRRYKAKERNHGPIMKMRCLKTADPRIRGLPWRSRKDG